MNDIWDMILNDDNDVIEESTDTLIENSNVYLIISDMHLSYKNKNSRIDYLKENEYCIEQLNRIIDRYIVKNNKVTLLFLGDFTDCSFKDQAKAVEINNLIVDFKKRVDECYFVIGNHETTYYRDNPVWTLFNSIESPSLNQVIKRSCKPQGLLPLGRVVDELIDGNVRFIFNHYDTPVITPKDTDYINIGLFHKDIICSAIVNDSKINHGVDLFTENSIAFDETSVFKNYNYTFMGHLHSVYGKWDFYDEKTGKSTEVNYLASLGRTNHTEVRNDFLTRNIPAVVIHDGEFNTIEDNCFDLMPREQCVSEAIVQKQKEIRESFKESKNVLNNFYPLRDDPLDNIQEYLNQNQTVLSIFKGYMQSDTIPLEDELKEKMEGLEWV